LAKIAVTSDAGSTSPHARTLARGNGWSVAEMVCTLGPRDRPFEERHGCATIAIVLAGSFQYRSRTGRDLMTPGSLMLGSAGQTFECSHDHGHGDRCVSFSYAPEFLDRLEAAPVFHALRLPPIRDLSPIIARVVAAAADVGRASWEELGIQLAGQVVELDRGISRETAAPSPGATARIARLVHMMEQDASRRYELSALAGEARLSPYHFLRTFEAVTGVTPHQYLLRMRLRQAALRLTSEGTKIVDIALDSGFGDVSNFVRMFRAEFGISPRIWRQHG
jgi:AraC family transcriptional regulator